MPRSHPSVEETEDLASDILPPGLLMVHNASRCCQHDVAELNKRNKEAQLACEVEQLTKKGSNH
jgi:hypothetical protein